MGAAVGETPSPTETDGLSVLISAATRGSSQAMHNASLSSLYVPQFLQIQLNSFFLAKNHFLTINLSNLIISNVINLNSPDGFSRT